MSQETVEIVREGYAAWERGEIDLIVEGADPDVEIVQPPEVPDSKTYRGKAGVVEAFADWPKQWDEFRTELVEVIDVSDTKVISVSRHYLRARDIDIEQEVANVHTFRDGLLIRWEIFFTRAEALEAAGLSEP
jgi:ketosteroid isomerase-like protein